MHTKQTSHSAAGVADPRDIKIRPASVGDAAALAALFEMAYAHSSHPCKSREFVDSAIESGAIHWRVATHGVNVVACMAAVPHSWNRSWEVGRAVTHPDFRSGGLGSAIFEQCVGFACQSAACDILHGFPRNGIIARMSARANPALLVTGHDGGINVANGVREYHAVVVGRNPRAQFRHVLPRLKSDASVRFIRERIYRGTGFEPEPGTYPEVWVAGPGDSNADGLFALAHNPLCPSDSIEVLHYRGRAKTGEAVADSLFTALDHAHPARHVRVAVLADKESLIDSLSSAGFEMTAYLPAWWARDGSRFDCVLMVRSRFEEVPACHGLDDAVRLFREAQWPAAQPRAARAGVAAAQ